MNGRTGPVLYRTQNNQDRKKQGGEREEMGGKSDPAEVVRKG